MVSFPSQAAPGTTGNSAVLLPAGTVRNASAAARLKAPRVLMATE